MNFYLKTLPLQGKDLKYFCGVRKRLRSTSADSEGKQKRKNYKYVSWRRWHMLLIERTLFDEDHSRRKFLWVAFSAFFLQI